MIILIARLPLPPSVNEMYANSASGRILSSKAKEYKELVYYSLLQGIIEDPYQLYFIDQIGARAIRETSQSKSKGYKFRVDYHFFFDSERRDIDNGIKCLQDVLMQWVGLNDNKIVSMRAERIVKKQENPYVDVVVRQTQQYTEKNELIKMALSEIHVEEDMYTSSFDSKEVTIQYDDYATKEIK